MYRTKWMIIHGLDPRQTYVIDLYTKGTAVMCTSPEELVWQTLYELGVRKSFLWRLFVESYSNRLFTWLFKTANESLFNESLEEFDEKLIQIQQEMLLRQFRFVAGDEEEDPEDNRSKAN